MIDFHLTLRCFLLQFSWTTKIFVKSKVRHDDLSHEKNFSVVIIASSLVILFYSCVNFKKAQLCNSQQEFVMNTSQAFVILVPSRLDGQIPLLNGICRWYFLLITRSNFITSYENLWFKFFISRALFKRIYIHVIKSNNLNSKN